MENGTEISVTGEAVNDYLGATEKAIADYLAGMQEIEGLQDLINLNGTLVNDFADAYDLLTNCQMRKH